MFIRDSRRSYRAYSYAELILITDLCSFGTPVGVTELILMQNFLFLCRTYTYNQLMFIRDSRRSYRAFSYAELILITDLCSFGTPVGVYRTYAYRGTLRLYKTYTYIIGFILILWRLHMFGGTRRYYRDITERILVLRNLFLYGSTRKYY